MPPAPPLLPAGFRPLAGEDRLPPLLGYALAVEAGKPLRPEDAPARRSEAERLLSEWAFRHLHNRLEDIRAEAAAEARAQLPRPPGLAKLVLANLLALILLGAALWALAVAGLPPSMLLPHLLPPGH